LPAHHVAFLGCRFLVTRMRSSILRFGIVSVLALTTLTACEYELKDEPTTQGEEEVPADEEENSPEEDAKPVERKRPEESDVRPTLAHGKAYEGSSTLPAGSKRIDLLNLQATNGATLATNAPGEKIDALFDGADDSLLRTPNINPLDTTITFTQPTKLKALRVRSTYSDFAVAVQIDGGERIILDPIPEGDWGLIVWQTPVTAKKVLVQTLRKVRDNYVHVNEIELYQ